MNYESKSKEDLIKDLQQFQQSYDSLKQTLNTDFNERKQVEESLRMSEERYQLLFNKAPLGYQSLDIDGNFIEVNQQWLDTLGYEQQEVIGKWFGDFLTPAYKDCFRKRFPKFKAQGHIHSEFEMLHKNGNILFIAFEGKIGYDLKGDFKQTHCILQDITDKKRTEKALRESEEKYRLLYENAGIGIGYYKVDGTIISYNNIAAKNMNGVPEDFNGKSIYEFFPKPVAELYHERIKKAVLSEIPVNYEDEVNLPTANKYFLSTYTRIINVNGEIEGVQILSHDITDRKQAEEDLLKSEAKLSAIFTSMSEMVVLHELVFDGEGKPVNYRITECNEAYTRITGITRNTAVGGLATEVYGTGEPPYLNEFLEVALTGEPYHYETYFEPMGKHFSISVICPEKNHFATVTTDITERKQAELLIQDKSEEIAVQNEELNQANIELIVAKGKAEENEVMLKAAMDNSQAGIAIAEYPSGKLIYVNKAGLLIRGKEYDDIVKDVDINKYVASWQILHFDGSPYESDEVPLARAVLYGETNSREFIVRRDNLEDRYVWANAAPIYNKQGKQTSAIVVFLDITEQKQAEAIFKDVIEKNPMSIQILDMEGYLIQVNSAHTKLFGVKPPSDYSVLKDTQLLSLGFSEFFEQIKNGEVVYFPDTYYNVHDVDPSFPDSPIWVKALGFTLNNNNGKPNKIVLMHENITERKNAEALLNDIIENNPMSIQIVDKEGCMLRVNPSFLELFGSVPPPQFSIFDDLKSKSPEMENLVTHVINGEIVHLPDIYFNAHDAVAEAPDIPLWIRALIFPLKNSAGKPERFVFMHENITERKIAEQELVIAKNHAEESDRLKSAFLANMSHEIRTPMNGILGFAEVLKDPDLTGDQQQKYIGIIEKSGARMLNIINDIIDISRIEAGLMKVSKSESNINEQMEYIYTFFKPEVESKGMELFIKNALPAKLSIIQTDREKIYAILTNLVKNAIKYTHQGSIEFGYILTDSTTQTSDKKVREVGERNFTSELQFYVKDTGIGIPKDRQQAVFERFIQADISDKRAYQGAGLGLSITKAYIELLGGKIWVESEECVGSCFYFTIPYIQELKKENKETEKLVSNENAENQNRKIKVLIADDDPSSRMLISMVIRKFSYEILEVETGVEAVELCRNNSDIDLIIMDVKMPEMDGYEATKKIREFNNNIIIIIQTAFALSGDKEDANAAGCNDYLSKPFTSASLLALLNKYFNKEN